MKKSKISLALASMLLVSSASFGNDKTDILKLQQEVKDLKEMTQILVDETSDLKTGFNYTKVDETKRYTGLGSAASKVYYSKSPLSIGGYGEMYYSSSQKAGSETQIKRFITYFGYKFSDNIILNSELEYEGGGVKATSTGATGDTVAVEFMYLDFIGNKNFNARLGNFLLPMGLMNEQHEPTLFTTIQRPNTAKYVIPTTWNTSGAMVYGEIADGIEYKASIITALQITDTGDKWVRNGRGSGRLVKNPDAAGQVRVDYTGTSGLLIGASSYFSKDLFMFDVHLDYKIGNARVYGTYAQNKRVDTNASQQVTANYGGFLNASYNVASLLGTDKKTPLFVQYERYNPQSEVSNGGTAGDATTDVTLGINFFPHEQVVLKAEYVISDNVATGNITGISLGFVF